MSYNMFMTITDLINYYLSVCTCTPGCLLMSVMAVDLSGMHSMHDGHGAFEAWGARMSARPPGPPPTSSWDQQCSRRSAPRARSPRSLLAKHRCPPAHRCHA
jgi:hypothetical protein